ncbi:MAG: OprO/OprP family phosphate-selective porin [Cyanobacteria bacterium]|nr:OprO/OprP family phosphate-selective porin [Cyanobacteriota bacterium]
MKRLLFVAILTAGAAVPAAAQNKGKRGFVWDDRPTIVFGEDVNIAVTGRALVEWRWFDTDLGENLFALRAGRLGLKGDLTKHFDWEVEREIGGGDLSNDESRIEFGDWKDVYVRWRTFDAARVKAGRFKIPFGLEQNTGVSELDFAYRALGSRTIAPGRDTGVMISGELGRFGYEAGVFDDDGDNAESSEIQFVREGEDLKDVGPSFAVRVTGDLFRALPVPGRLRSANVGVAYTIADVPEGLNSLRGASFWGTEDFVERVYVKGRRQRYGAQFDWSPGPASLKAEWMQSREQRNGQSNRDEDLSDFIASAWYVAGTWFVTGEDKDDNVNARRPLWKGGPGAIELAVRYERLAFESASKQGTSFTNPRAQFLTPNSDTVVTAGVNWITSRWTRVILNAIHEDFADPARTPIVGTTSFWSGVVRLNVVF